MAEIEGWPLDIHHPCLHHSLVNDLKYLKQPQREKNYTVNTFAFALKVIICMIVRKKLEFQYWNFRINYYEFEFYFLLTVRI